MDDLLSLIKQKENISIEIAAIISMRKGVLNEQYSSVTKKDGTLSVRGPYYVLTYKGPRGKTISKAIQEKNASYIKSETENYKKFKQLCERYIKVCEKISELRNGGGGHGKNQDTRI
jgi:hypothetical protein